MNNLHNGYILTELTRVDSLDDIEATLDIFGKYEVYIHLESVDKLPDTIIGDNLKHSYVIKTNKNNTYECDLYYNESIKTCTIDFNTDLPNNTGFQSFEIFKAIKESAKNSFLIHQMIYKFDTLIFRVYKNEPKRKKLYLNMVSKYLKSFEFLFENTKLSDEYDELVFIKK